MPRNVRNFWLEGSIDGRSSGISGGPQAKDGGFSLTIYQREDGSVGRGIRIDGRTLSDGRVLLSVFDGESDAEVYRLCTHRDETGREVVIPEEVTR